jgi:hypothetical protein
MMVYAWGQNQLHVRTFIAGSIVLTAGFGAAVRHPWYGAFFGAGYWAVSAATHLLSR